MENHIESNEVETVYHCKETAVKELKRSYEVWDSNLGTGREKSIWGFQRLGLTQNPRLLGVRDQSTRVEDFREQHVRA